MQEVSEEKSCVIVEVFVPWKERCSCLWKVTYFNLWKDIHNYLEKEQIVEVIQEVKTIWG